MVSCAYLRRQAALCLRMAAAVDDQSMVAALVVIADDFSNKADEVDPSLGSTGLASTGLASNGAAAADRSPAGTNRSW
jgi:hypothetical protein